MLAQNKEIYPEGEITGYYGELTIKAVQRFQEKYNIATSGTPETTGYGLAGPTTRQKLNEIFSSQYVSPPASEIEQLKEQIKLLQMKVIQLLSEITKILQEKVNRI